MKPEIIVERELTTLEKKLLEGAKKGNYMLFWVGKYRRRFTFKKNPKRKNTLLWFTNYFEFGGEENE